MVDIIKKKPTFKQFLEHTEGSLAVWGIFFEIDAEKVIFYCKKVKGKLLGKVLYEKVIICKTVIRWPDNVEEREEDQFRYRKICEINKDESVKFKVCMNNFEWFEALSGDKFYIEEVSFE